MWRQSYEIHNVMWQLESIAAPILRRRFWCNDVIVKSCVRLACCTPRIVTVPHILNCRVKVYVSAGGTQYLIFVNTVYATPLFIGGGISYIEGILPKRPYLPCVSMARRALLAGYHRYLVIHPLPPLGPASVNWVAIGSSNGSPPIRHQAINWTNAEVHLHCQCDP